MRCFLFHVSSALRLVAGLLVVCVVVQGGTLATLHIACRHGTTANGYYKDGGSWYNLGVSWGSQTGTNGIYHRFSTQGYYGNQAYDQQVRFSESQNPTYNSIIWTAGSMPPDLIWCGCGTCGSNPYAATPVYQLTMGTTNRTAYGFTYTVRGWTNGVQVYSTNFSLQAGASWSMSWSNTYKPEFLVSRQQVTGDGANSTVDISTIGSSDGNWFTNGVPSTYNGSSDYGGLPALGAVQPGNLTGAIGWSAGATTDVQVLKELGVGLVSQQYLQNQQMLVGLAAMRQSENTNVAGLLSNIVANQLRESTNWSNAISGAPTGIVSVLDLTSEDMGMALMGVRDKLGIPSSVGSEDVALTVPFGALEVAGLEDQEVLLGANLSTFRLWVRGLLLAMLSVLVVVRSIDILRGIAN